MAIQEKPYLRTVSLRSAPPSSAYPFNIPSISKMGELQFHEDVTFIIGENGTGKSTLLESIAVILGLGKEGGTQNVFFETADTVSELHNWLKAVKSYKRPKESYFLRAESFYNVATFMDTLAAEEEERGIPREITLRSYGGRSLHHQSHGESFMTVLLKKFRGNGLYILDEPEAALSPVRQLAALAQIHQLVIRNSQFIIATHSPILLSYPSAKIVQLDENGARIVSYEETDHYQVTKRFLNDYRRQLSYLCS